MVNSPTAQRFHARTRITTAVSPFSETEIHRRQPGKADLLSPRLGSQVSSRPVLLYKGSTSAQSDETSKRTSVSSLNSCSNLVRPSHGDGTTHTRRVGSPRTRLRLAAKLFVHSAFIILHFAQLPSRRPARRNPRRAGRHFIYSRIAKEPVAASDLVAARVHICIFLAAATSPPAASRRHIHFPRKQVLILAVNFTSTPAACRSGIAQTPEKRPATSGISGRSLPVGQNHIILCILMH